MNRIRGRVKLTMLVGAVLMVAAMPVFASGGGEVEMVPFFSSNFLWSLINFGILAFLLYRFGKKPFKDGLANRQERIEQALREAEDARATAARNLADAEERLRQKDAEVRQVLEEAGSIAARERERMIAQGRELSEQVVSQTRENLDQELKKARETLRAEAVTIAMELAEARIRGAVDPDLQERLLREAIEKMEGMN